MSEQQKATLLPEDAATRLQEMGYRGRVIRDGAIVKVESATNGAKFFVNFFSPQDNDPSKGYEEIQFDSGYALPNDVNSARLIQCCNKFNSEYRFAKVAVYGQKYRYVTMKIDFPILSHKPNSFEQCASIFITLLQNFIDEVIQSDACQEDGCTKLHCDAIAALFGSNRNPESAIELYRQAAERGYAGSQNNLGDQYECAENLPKSDEFAIYWYTRAAERGEPTAYLSLATLLSQKAVDREMLIEAAKFAFLAVERLPDGLNKKTGRDCLAALSKRLEEEDFELAHALAQSWMPLFQEHRLMSDTPKSRELELVASHSLH